jgi:hypothetical protein
MDIMLTSPPRKNGQKIAWMKDSNIRGDPRDECRVSGVECRVA